MQRSNLMNFILFIRKMMKEKLQKENQLKLTTNTSKKYKGVLNELCQINKDKKKNLKDKFSLKNFD
jgi:hypothetical protein